MIFERTKMVICTTIIIEHTMLQRSNMLGKITEWTSEEVEINMDSSLKGIVSIVETRVFGGSNKILNEIDVLHLGLEISLEFSGDKLSRTTLLRICS